MAHGLDFVVDAEYLKERIDIKILFVGGSAAREKLECYVKSKNLKNVVLIPRQPKEAISQIWCLCDVSGKPAECSIV